MDTNKILSADFLDLLFDNRNKEYGAYELRKTYQSRITRSLIFTGILVGLTFTGVVLANKLEPKQKSMFVIRDLTIEDIEPIEKEPDPLPEPPRRIEPVQVQTERLTQFAVVDDKDVVEPPPTQDDLANAKIDVIQADGGTRTAAITGGFIALVDAVNSVFRGVPANEYPLRGSVAAVSVGIVDGTPTLDLDFARDVRADVDMNVVMTGGGRFIEIQGTGEESTFDDHELAALIELAKQGIGQLSVIQQQSLGIDWPWVGRGHPL